MSGNGFEIGDVVEWQSSANASRKTKRGTIVAIVPPGKTPYSNLHHFPKPDGYCTSKMGGGLGRPAQSYFVAVERPKSKPLLYWPNAKQLRLVPVSDPSH